MKSITLMQWAIICTIRQQPDYTFSAHELRNARKMVELGLLTEHENTPHWFKVTDLGLELYRKPTTEELQEFERS